MAKVMYKMPRPNDEERSPNEASEAKNPATGGAARRAGEGGSPSVVALGVELAERVAERGCRSRRRLRCCVSLAERN